MNNVKKYTGIVLLILLVFFKIQDSNFVMKVENIAYDAYQNLFIEKDNYDGVVIVDIDEKSIGEIGQFPWRRDIFAKLINRLDQYGSSVIAFDIFFSEEDKQNPKKILEEFNIENDKVIDSDQQLLESINSSKVVLAILGDVSAYNKENNSKPKTNIISRGDSAANHVYSFKNKIGSLEKFNNVAAGIGTISYLDSPDAVLRSIPLFLKIDNDIWPALSLETLRVLHDHKSILINSDETGINLIKTRKYEIKSDPNAIVHINYKEFKKENYIPAVDVLNMSVNANKLRDKIVIIGSSAQGLFDFVKIPNGDVIPGVQTHAHLIENIVNDDFIIKNVYTAIIENILLLISLALVLIIPNKILPKYSIFFFSGLVLILISSSMIVYQFNYFVDVLYIILSSSLLFLTTLYFRYLRENEIAIENEKKQIVLKQEREIAGEVQKKLFPKEFEQKNILYAKNVPARDVSGDYYDYIKISEDEFYFTLADVSGKGVKAGILMANAAAVFRSMAKLHKEVSTIARYINNQVADSSYQGMFVTAVVGKYNIKDKKIEYINLGHEPIMVYDENFNFEYYKSTLPPLGIMAMDNDDFFKTNEINLANKNLVIYTDGVTEGYLENNQELEAKGVEKEIIDYKFKLPEEIIEHFKQYSNQKKRAFKRRHYLFDHLWILRIVMKILIFFFIFISITKAHANLFLSEVLNKPEDLEQAFLFVEQEKDNKVNEAIYALEVLKKVYPKNLEIKTKLFDLYEKTKNEKELKKLLNELKEFENVPNYITSKMNELIVSQNKSEKENLEIPKNNSNGIKYSEILNNPTDLELNLRFAKEQESLGNYKAVIATLERLSDLYSENLDLKLYLLSISLKTDSKERTKDIIDQIKRSPALTNAIRQRLDEIIKTLDQQENQKNNEWVQFVDIGFNSTLDNNVNTMSDSGTLYISDSLSNYAANTIDDDDFQNTSIKYGAYKQLSKTSNINFNIGKAFTRQNRDKNKENDLHSLFVNYNKQINKNYISTFYTFNENNNIHESDYLVHSLILENRYGLKPNQNLVLSGNYSLTDYRTDNTFTSAEDKNNEAQGLAVGYEYFFNQNNNIKIKYGFNDYNAKLDSYGYDNEYQRISYSTRIKNINFNLSQTINYNTYDKADTFVKSDTIRDDKIRTNTVSMSGSLDQLLNYKFLKGIFYSLSYTDIKSTSNILNYDYNKDLYKFGLTKRISF